MKTQSLSVMYSGILDKPLMNCRTLDVVQGLQRISTVDKDSLQTLSMRQVYNFDARWNCKNTIRFDL